MCEEVTVWRNVAHLASLDTDAIACDLNSFAFTLEHVVKVAQAPDQCQWRGNASRVFFTMCNMKPVIVSLSCLLTAPGSTKHKLKVKRIQLNINAMSGQLQLPFTLRERL